MKFLFSWFKLIKRKPIIKGERLERRPPGKVTKHWFTNEYKDYYCKFIENGQELIGVITSTCYETLDNGKTRKSYALANKEYSYAYSFYPSDRIVILGRSVDETIRLKYENQLLKRKVENQKVDLKNQHSAVIMWQKAFSRRSKEFDELKKEAITKEDLSKCLIVATESPAIGLTSSDEKERKLVGLIIKELKNERKN